MKDLRKIKIYLLDRNFEMCSAWKNKFMGTSNVSVICDDFVSFMKKYRVDCVVSPANAYGLMDGGYDLAITEWFGDGLQKKVQRYIIDNLCGEQPVGTSIVVDTDVAGVKLIHTPTMRFPGYIKDNILVYHCMRTCLMAAMKSDVDAVVIPAFGGMNGAVPYEILADMMWRAYMQIINKPERIDWDYARKNDF